MSMSEDAILREVQRSNQEVAKTITEFRVETTQAFGRVDTAIGRMDERLEAHKTETDRRFTETGTDVELAHKRIGEVRTDVGNIKPGGSSMTRDGAMVGGGGTVAMILAWLRDFFSSGGASSS